MSSEKVGNLIFPARLDDRRCGNAAVNDKNTLWQGRVPYSKVRLLSVLRVLRHLVSGMLLLHPKNKETAEDSTRLLMQVGGSSLLPQLLAALGAVFTSAGVGTRYCECNRRYYT